MIQPEVYVDHVADWDCCGEPYEAHPKRKEPATGLHRYLVRYINARGVPMPVYGTGSKIIEEAYELQEAVQLKDRERIMEESFDVMITALVAAHQFGFTLEEAAELKIRKDTGRGEKKSA